MLAGLIRSCAWGGLLIRNEQTETKLNENL